MTIGADADGVPARLFRLSVGVFFIGGFLSSLVSLFVPRMTLIYGLDYTRALFIQLAFHMSYLLFAVPIALAVMRIGYMRAVAVGLGTMAVSCCLFLTAHGLHDYALVLASLLALSGGITFLQIASNTVATVVGGSAGAAYRLTLLQAFNAIGTVLAPLVGASFVLGGDAVAGLAAVRAIAPPFLFAILLLALLCVLFTQGRDLLRFSPQADTRGRLDLAGLLADRRLLGGAVAIFVYVGAEVGIGTLLTNYLVMPDVIAADPVTAARLVSLYWAGSMVGRLAGAAVMRRVRPPVLLSAAAAGAAVLTVTAAAVQGWVGATALLAVGLCNSIMYPTIYVLALPAEPARATPASTLLCMAVVGGAVLPLVTGMAADRAGLATALTLPALCYLVIGLFALSRAKGEAAS